MEQKLVSLPQAEVNLYVLHPPPVTSVSSVACPVQGSVSSLVQPVHADLVLDAFPQPAQITCSSEEKGQTSLKAKNQDGCWPQSEEMHNNPSVGRCRTSFGCFVHWIVDRLCLLSNYNEPKQAISTLIDKETIKNYK